MTSRPSSLESLIESVLEERAETVSFSADEIDREALKLREGFARIRASLPARRHVVRAVERLPGNRQVGWLGGVQSAIKVVLGEARRTSQILVDAASDLLPIASEGGWAFSPAAVATTRSGETLVTKAESTDSALSISRTAVVDDTGAERRLLVTIDNYPDGPVPVLLIVAEDDAYGDRPAMEVDPEVESPQIEGTGTRRRLRYEVVLPAGGYFAFFGNPRDAR